MGLHEMNMIMLSLIVGVNVGLLACVGVCAAYDIYEEFRRWKEGSPIEDKWDRL